MNQQVTVDVTDRRHELQDVEQRKQATKQIVQNMQDLHQTTQDLAIAVDGQQDILNLTEVNIEDVKTTQQQATSTIEKVERHRSAYRKKRLWCIILTVILAAIILLVLILVLKP